jgi:DNA-binding transcriptional LysR family regulator
MTIDSSAEISIQYGFKVLNEPMPYDGRLLSGVTVLMAVVEARSMARAAEALGLTPSGVGRAISRLETRVGVRLLERTTRSMTLTDEGRRFYEEVGPHLDGIEQAATRASGSAAVVRGRLRVNVDPFFSRMVLAGQIASFLEKHREVRIELIMRDHVGDLVADGFDLALRFGDPPTGVLHCAKARRNAHPDRSFARLHRRAWQAHASFGDRWPTASIFMTPRTAGPLSGSFGTNARCCRSR